MIKMFLFQAKFQLKEKFETLIGGSLIDWGHPWLFYVVKEKAPQSHDFPSCAAWIVVTLVAHSL